MRLIDLLGTLFDAAPTAVTVVGFVALFGSFLWLYAACLRDEHRRR